MPRPRKTIEQHLLDGTYRRDRHGPIPRKLKNVHKTPMENRPKSIEPISTSQVPFEAAALWDLVTSTRILEESDKPMLAMMCQYWVQMGRCLSDLEKCDHTSRGTYIKSLRAASDGWKELAVRFGLSPADRAKLVEGKTEEEDLPKVESRPKTRLDSAPPPNLKIAGA